MMNCSRCQMNSRFHMEGSPNLMEVGHQIEINGMWMT